MEAQCWICPECHDDRHHKPDDAYCQAMQENEELRQQLQQAEARVAELEESGTDLVSTFDQTLTDTLDFEDYETLKRVVEPFRAIAENSKSGAWLLRKQAEAVEAWLYGNPEMGELTDYAQRLRQQADEMEGNR